MINLLYKPFLLVMYTKRADVPIKAFRKSYLFIKNRMQWSSDMTVYLVHVRVTRESAYLDIIIYASGDDLVTGIIEGHC